MADLEPTYFKIKSTGSSGLNQGELLKIVYNLSQAVVAICNNLDGDIGSTGIDYMEKIGTDLQTALSPLRTPTSGETV